MIERKYDVALSFAGEDRKYAEELAELLQSGGYSSFYDKYERTRLWGKDLYQHLSSVYKVQARYCVMFLSQNYARTLWARHELKNAQARAFEENQEYILPVRLDDTEIPGILPTVGYLDLREMCIEQVYQALVRKLQDHTSQVAVANESTRTDNPSTKNARMGSMAQSHQNEGTEGYLNTYKRHDDLKEVIPQILKQMEERSETRFRSSDPNLTVAIRPAFPHRSVISTSNIYEFMRVESSIPFNDSAIEFGTRKVKGGACFMGIPDSSIYWELNEYGVIYHRLALSRIPSRETYAFDTEEGIEEEYLSFDRFVRDLGNLIPVARSFYKKCCYSDEIEFAVQLRQICGEKLMYDEDQHPDEIQRQESVESTISASVRCLPRELVKAEKLISVVDALTDRLIWVFNVNDHARLNKVEAILTRCRLV